MRKVFLLGSLFLGFVAMAQKQKQGAATASNKAVRNGVMLKFFPVSWGRGDTGKIQVVSPEQFRNQLREKLVVHTPGWQLERFDFMYGERGMYEDSAGSPIVLTDYMTQICKGDSLPESVYQYLPTHAKAGDTAYFNNIVVSNPAGVRAFGTPFRVVLQR